MQNYDPKIAFILGRKWSKNSKTGNNSFDYLGKIDIYGDDLNIQKKTLEAISWLKELKTNGHNLDEKNIKISPNLKCNYDDEWRHVKRKIAEENKDITLLWNCGVKERNYMFKNNIRGWDNSECYASKIKYKWKKSANY